MSLSSQFHRVRTLRQKLFPPPKQEMWIPRGVYVTEEDGEYFYADTESEAIDARCTQLGIIPNIYVVSENWHPERDGVEA